MATVEDFDEVVEQYHLALNDFLKGNPQPVKSFFSHRDDVTLANPLVGLPARGRERVGWANRGRRRARAASSPGPECLWF
jgi:hypothetical protein